MKSSSLELLFDTLWEQDYPELPAPEQECKVIEGRKFAFDRCFRDARLLICLQGGTWQQGRHTRGAGYERDCEKLCLAAAEGYRVFYLTTTMLRNDPARWLGLIAEAIEGDDK